MTQRILSLYQKPGSVPADWCIVWLTLPADLTPGSYLLWAGMYDYETVQNLEVFSSGTSAVDGRVLLGEVEVVAP